MAPLAVIDATLSLQRSAASGPALLGNGCACDLPVRAAADIEHAVASDYPWSFPWPITGCSGVHHQSRSDPSPTALSTVGDASTTPVTHQDAAVPGVIEDRPASRAACSPSCSSGRPRHGVRRAFRTVAEARQVVPAGNGGRADHGHRTARRRRGEPRRLPHPAQPGLGIDPALAYDLRGHAARDAGRRAQRSSCLWKAQSLTREILLEAMARGLRAWRDDARSRAIDRTRPRAGRSRESLTDRQSAVLQLLATGRSNTGIATRLGIAEKSVQSHLTAIYAALGIEHDTLSNPRVSAVPASWPNPAACPDGTPGRCAVSVAVRRFEVVHPPIGAPPRQTGCLNRPSGVHSPKRTFPMRTGSTQFASDASAGGHPRVPSMPAPAVRSAARSPPTPDR